MSDCSDTLETATAWFKEEKEEDGGSTTGLLMGGNVCVDGATFATQTTCECIYVLKLVKTRLILPSNGLQQ